MIIFLVAAGGCSSPPKRMDSSAPGGYGYTKAYISWLIENQMKKHGVEGLSIALVDDQSVVWAQGFGLADKKGEIAATPDTVYRVGSVSKLFTAVAALKLSEQGKLDLDRPLTTYLPDFSVKSRFPDAGPVTARNIMTHHSGLPSDLVQGMWSRNPEPFEHNLNKIKNGYLSYPPNFVFSYSNLAVALLGQAEETVAQRPFSAFMAESILRPLGMSHSRFAAAPDHSPQASKAYRDGDEVEELPLRDVPAGGLNSTVLDLARFIKMVFAGGKGEGGELLSPQSVAESLRPQNGQVPLDLNFRVGLGWALGGLGNIDIKNAGLVAHHAGATLYHRSMLIVLPEQKLGVVVLANTASAKTVVDQVATETLKLALEARKGIVQPEAEPPKPAPGAVSPAELDGWQGFYATSAGVAQLEKKSGYLKARLNGVSLRLIPRTDGLLGLEYRLLGMIPVSLGPLDRLGFARQTIAGREILKVREGSQELLVGEKILPLPISEKWRERLGEYQILNRGEDAPLLDEIRLKEEGGLLLVEYALPLFAKGTTTLALAPLSDSEAVIRGVGRQMGETLRVIQADGDELLLYSGYRLKRKK